MELPIVFISSTKEDLVPYRDAARDAAMKADFHPEMMEYFAAGGNKPLQTCLEKVNPCDVLVVIVAYRYGWIPEDQPGAKQKSITWLECEQAIANGKEVLAFIVDEKYNWREQDKEGYRLTLAMNNGTAKPELFNEVNTCIQKLNEFKNWLKKRGTICPFTDKHSLAGAVLHALNTWKQKQGSSNLQKKPIKTAKKNLEIPAAYRAWLYRQCGTVELLAHLLKQGCVPPRRSSI